MGCITLLRIKNISEEEIYLWVTTNQKNIVIS
jgi:hypothetical protein